MFGTIANSVLNVSHLGFATKETDVEVEAFQTSFVCTLIKQLGLFANLVKEWLCTVKIEKFCNWNWSSIKKSFVDKIQKNGVDFMFEC